MCIQNNKTMTQKQQATQTFKEWKALSIRIDKLLVIHYKMMRDSNLAFQAHQERKDKIFKSFVVA